MLDWLYDACYLDMANWEHLYTYASSTTPSAPLPCTIESSTTSLFNISNWRTNIPRILKSSPPWSPELCGLRVPDWYGSQKHCVRGNALWIYGSVFLEALRDVSQAYRRTIRLWDWSARDLVSSIFATPYESNCSMQGIQRQRRSWRTCQHTRARGRLCWCTPRLERAWCIWSPYLSEICNQSR